MSQPVVPSTTTPDAPLAVARAVVERTRAGAYPRPVVASFFDEATFTVSHVMRDPDSPACAIVDSVLDFDAPGGRTADDSARHLVDYVGNHGLHVDWLLETHAHADHLSAAPLLQARVGGRLAIGAHITTVQETFGRIFNAGARFARDGSQFDRLFADGDGFRIGALMRGGFLPEPEDNGVRDLKLPVDAL
ncbi:MBL fold metallo-hydrolase [Luteimonas sp. MHLX1A]|nr:MBL fold metallo-hydrolase [Luteimonas sp. MHLX1A]MCD9047329.1 MBL fold metallo-hydrolase [Luteimonas sp. MHLX1A]